MPNRVQKKIIFLCILVLGLQLYAGAQKAHLSLFKKDTTLTMRKPHPYPDPKLAMLYSIVLPGLGQAYNKKWWKIPIIYAGLGTMAYFEIVNQQQYNLYHTALQLRDANQVDNNAKTKIYTAADLVTIQEYYYRYKWLSIFGGAFIYLLNIVDANVDAQLHGFDVNNNLSFHIAPVFFSNLNSKGKYDIQPGFCLIKRF